MSKRCKTRTKVKKIKKENKFKNQNNYFANKCECEDTNIVFCQKKGCIDKWNDMVRVQKDEDKLTNLFLCKKHADEFEYELGPDLQNNIKKINIENELEAIYKINDRSN